jgi:beta-glucosidase
MLALLATCAEGHVYLDPKQPIAARVADLLPRMTVQEKIQQTWTTHTSAATAKQWANIGVGAVKYMSAFTCDPSEIGKCIEQRNALQEEFINSSRLGIPISFVNEGLHGGAPGGTIFPMPVGLGSSWNVDLVRSVMGVVGNEAARIGVDVVFAPVVNMMTDPRFGRLQEGYSSNPLLTSHLAVAAVLALQGCEGNATAATCGPKAYLNASGVGALGKHYAAYGASEGGLNGGPAAISNRTLHEVFLRPWKAMAEVGLRACMPSHNTVLDVPAHASKWLIDTTLRGTFGFEGVALSDCNDIGVIYDFRMATNRTAAAALALNAGTTWDLQCGTDPEQWGYNKIADALADGLVSDATLDETVRTVLTLKFSHGLFDGRAFVSAADIASVGAFLDRAAHRALARTAAQQSMVLLLNRGAEALGDGQRGGDRGALPWATLPKKIALIGPTVTTSTCEDSVIGAYVLEGANVVCLDAALDAAGVAYSVSGAVDTTAPTVQDADVSEADAAAIASAVAAVNDPLTTAAIVVLGDLSGKVCGEWGDRDDLTLSGAQLPLLKAVVAAAAARNGNRSATGRSAPPRFSVVVVLTHGRPQTFGDATSGGGEPLLAQVRSSFLFANSFLCSFFCLLMLFVCSSPSLTPSSLRGALERNSAMPCSIFSRAQSRRRRSSHTRGRERLGTCTPARHRGCSASRGSGFQTGAERSTPTVGGTTRTARRTSTPRHSFASASASRTRPLRSHSSR